MENLQELDVPVGARASVKLPPLDADGEGKDARLREKILAVLCADGADRTEVENNQNLAAAIDSLQMLELVEVLETAINRSLPEEELTEDNFSSLSALVQMAGRLSEGK